GRLSPAPSAFSVPVTSQALQRFGSRRPVDQPETCEVGELVGFRRVLRPGYGRGGQPRPARDGSAASHLGGRVLFMQAGPPRFSRAANTATEAGVWQLSPPNIPPEKQPATPKGRRMLSGSSA